MAIVIAFAGKIGSGKTSASMALSERLGCPRASFGDYVRDVVRLRGVALTRENLQSVGTELLETDLYGFCRAVLLSGGWNSGKSLVIDGLRHAETIKPIEQIISPAKLGIVFLSIEEDTRIERLAQRGEGDRIALALADAHSSEQQVNSTLVERAHLILNGSQPTSEVIRRVEEWIQNQ